MTAIVEIDAVAKRYGDIEALTDVTLSVEAGETLALVGHNGAGKTTLMKLMLGLIEPSSGSVRIDGDDPAGKHGAMVRHHIGFLPESVAFPGTMTGREIMAFYCRLKGEPTAAGKPLLERVGLGDAGRRRVGTYSKGMRQRLGVAQALIGRPRLLLLDEPTTGLDPALRREFYTMLGELAGQGVAVILSSHALAEIEDKADRFALVGNGRLLAHDRLSALTERTEMPLRISLVVETCTTGRIIEALGGRIEVVSRAPDRLVVECRPSAKMDILRRLGEIGDVVRDVEIELPGLEAIYHTLLAQAWEARK